MRNRIVRREHILPFSGLFWSMKVAPRAIEAVLKATVVQNRIFGHMHGGLGRDVHDSFKRMWGDIVP